MVIPILWAVALAFQNVRLINIRGTGFIGEYTLDNFIEVLTSPGFLNALWTTIVYSVFGTALAIGIGLIAALALRKPFRGRGLIRASLLLPYVAPVVAATFVWSTLLNPQYGSVNWFGTDRARLGGARSRSCRSARCRCRSSVCRSICRSH